MALSQLARTAFLRQVPTQACCWSRLLCSGVPQSEGSLTKAATNEQQLSSQLAVLFKNNPDHAAKIVNSSLTTQQRAELLCLLCQDSSKLTVQTNKRLQPLRSQCPHVRGEVEKLVVQQQATSDTSTSAELKTPSHRALLLIAVASGIPFIGFGFLDNVIMIIAGEEIDATFGARFGLSTLAAAGLGNLVADVAGISFANSIEQAMRKSNWTQEPPLSAAQHHMRSTKWAKAAGATTGVMIGCLLGLAPLFVMGKAWR